MKDQKQRDIDNAIFKKLMPILLALLFFLLAPKLFAYEENVKSGLFFPDTWTCPNLSCRYENFDTVNYCALCGSRRITRMSVNQSYEDGVQQKIQSRIYHMESMANGIKARFNLEDVNYGGLNPIETYHYIRGQQDACHNCLELLEVD